MSKHFNDVLAVDDLTLEIPSGSFFALLGPSGCGKTTTLRMIGGFEEPDAGTIEVGGKPVTGVPPYKREVNTVFQSYALFPHLNVFENVAFGLRRKKVPKPHLQGRTREILRIVGLEGFDERKPSQLSGGQQQRVALARALVNSPKVLLLDEPLGALDLKLRKQMQLELKLIQSELGLTFVHVTHDQEEAMTMADAIAVMNHGKIEQLGSPTELYERPRTGFVAGFLGVSNLLDGTVTTAGSVRVDGVGELRVGAELPTAGTRVRIGVRPEQLRLDATGANTLKGHDRRARVHRRRDAVRRRHLRWKAHRLRAVVGYCSRRETTSPSAGTRTAHSSSRRPHEPVVHQSRAAAPRRGGRSRHRPPHVVPRCVRRRRRGGSGHDHRRQETAREDAPVLELDALHRHR